jgi:N-carbamoylputrescine amidase
MKVTVCELRNDPNALELDWQALVAHVQSEASDFVLLPEMPFYPWVAETDQADSAVWEASVEAHDRWVLRLVDLAPAVAAGSRPVVRQGKRLNEGFVWDASSGYRAVHHKYYLPNEEGFWEATWYDRGDGEFALLETGKFRVGFMICTDLWFNFHARAYAKGGINLLVCPRATPASSVNKWIAGGKTAGVVSGAFCLSSNRGGESGHVKWGGGGWVIEPEEGELLGVTSQEEPFLTVEINLNVSKDAKRTYPRYVLD